MKTKINNLAARLLAKAWYNNQNNILTEEDEIAHEDFAWQYVEDALLGAVFVLEGYIVLEKCQDGIYLRDYTPEERETARMAEEATQILKDLWV